MTIGETSPRQVYLNKRLLMTGAALIAVGGLVGFAGMAIGGAAVVAALRQWVQQMEVSPRERAAIRWHQAREASLAGARAWREAAPPART
jgi:hypothetical protein